MTHNEDWNFCMIFPFRLSLYFACSSFFTSFVRLCIACLSVCVCVLFFWQNLVIKGENWRNMNVTTYYIPTSVPNVCRETFGTHRNMERIDKIHNMRLRFDSICSLFKCWFYSAATNGIEKQIYNNTIFSWKRPCRTTVYLANKRNYSYFRIELNALMKIAVKIAG